MSLQTDLFLKPATAQYRVSLLRKPLEGRFKTMISHLPSVAYASHTITTTALDQCLCVE